MLTIMLTVYRYPPAETIRTSLCRAQERKEIDDYGKNDEYKDTGTHIYKENRTDGLYLLSAIISMKMQRKQCRRRLTGRWLQKQTEWQFIKIM